MSYYTGRASATTTGSHTYTLGSFQPTWARITVAGNSSTDKANFSEGHVDGTRQNVQYTGSTGSNNTEVIHLVDSSNNSIMNASWTSFGLSGSTGTMTLNFTTTDSTLQFSIECGN